MQTTDDWQIDHDLFVNAKLQRLNAELKPGDFVLPSECKGGKKSDGTYVSVVNQSVFETGPLRPLSEMLANHVVGDMVASAVNNGGGLKFYKLRPHTEKDDPTKLIAWIYIGA